MADQEATDSSGVVLTPPCDPSKNEDTAVDHEEQENDCEAADERDDIVIRRQDLIEMQQQDPSLKEMLQAAEEPDTVFAIRDGILYFKKFSNRKDSEAEEKEDIPQPDPWVIVAPEPLRKTVIKAGHDHAGHLGAKKTRKMVESQFYWPGMASQIAKYCRACPVCLRYNSKKTKKEPLHPLPVISQPWDRVAIDIVGKLPRTRRGNCFILTVMDFATRYMEAIPLRRVDAVTTCNALMEVFAHFGLPREILSDNGSNFVAEVTEKLIKLLGVKHIKCSPYHPESNGMLERSHQVLKKTLDKLGASQTNWDEYLLLALRTAPHAALGISPYHLLFGRDARTPVSELRQRMEELEPAPKRVVEYISQLYKELETCQALVEKKDAEAKEKSKAYYDRDKKEDQLKPGELVLMMVPKGVDSLTCQWVGPFKVVKQLSTTTYLTKRSTRKCTGTC